MDIRVCWMEQAGNWSRPHSAKPAVAEMAARQPGGKMPHYSVNLEGRHESAG
jgi:hypothetical protein